jgi:hypothetical protein
MQLTPLTFKSIRARAVVLKLRRPVVARINTQELSSEDFAELKKEHNSFGWLVFAAQEQEFQQSALKKTARPQASGCAKGCSFVGKPK